MDDEPGTSYSTGMSSSGRIRFYAAVGTALITLPISAQEPGERPPSAPEEGPVDPQSPPEPDSGLSEASEHAVKSAPAGNQTPCDWLVERRDQGASLPDLIELASAQHGLFTARDIQCLRQQEFHKRVAEAARGPGIDERLDAVEAEREARRREELVGRYDIELVGVVVSPAKQDGRSWDGFGTVSPKVVQGALAFATGDVTVAPAVGEIATFFANATLSGTAAPDIFAYARLLGPDAPAGWANYRLSLLPPASPARDNYFAVFPNSPSFTGVRLSPGDAIRITLYDADLEEHDSIGTLDIGYDELMKAAGLQEVVQFSAASQTQNQVIVVQFAVRPAHSITPQMVGQVFQ